MNFLPEDDPRHQVWAACESPIEQILCCRLFSSFGCRAVAGAYHGERRAEMAEIASDAPAAFVFAQHRINRYRADFLVVMIDPVKRASSRLVIECDGAAYHTSEEQCAYDMARDAVIVAGGYEIIRLPGTDIYNDVGAALNLIAIKLRAFGVATEVPEDCAEYEALIDFAAMFVHSRSWKAKQALIELREQIIAKEEEDFRVREILRENATWM